MNAIRTINPALIQTTGESRRSGGVLPGTVAALTLVSNFVVLRPTQAFMLALAVGFVLVLLFFGEWLKLRRLYALAGLSLLGGALLAFSGLEPALSVALYATWIGVALMLSGLLVQSPRTHTARTRE